MSSRRVVFASLVLFLTACGGKVVFQEDGGEGGGGTGAAGPGPGPGPGGTGSLSSSSTGVTLTPCEQLCAGSLPNCFVPGPDCVGNCQFIYAPGCEKETDAYLLCFLANASSDCSLPGNQCNAEAQALGQCQPTRCFVDGEPCVVDSDCCSAFCDVDAFCGLGGCVPLDERCSNDFDCCSGFCDGDGFCA